MAVSKQLEVRVDTLGFLANNLRGYEPTSILREQLQNADDASHKQGRKGELQLRFLPEKLVVSNPSIFTEEDWKRLLQPNSRGKFFDADQTGEFGVGFWGALHLTDAPVVTSGERRVVLDPLEASEETIEYHEGTTFEFAYRRQPTDLSKELDAGLVTSDVETSMAEAFVHQMAELLLFTRAIDAITIELPDGSIRRAQRNIEPIAGAVKRLTVDVDGASDETCCYLTVHSDLADPPQGRHGRVIVAMPLTERHRGQGRAFFMFPTETDSGLHVSVDAHFWATDDRRSLENSGKHGEWNDRIFGHAGRAVGECLETVLDPAIHGLDVEDAIGWFVPAGSQLPHIRRRASLFTNQLDEEASRRAVIFDRAGRLRRGSELIRLPAEIEPLLADAVGDTAKPTKRQNTADVYKRWGLVTWGPAEVASWLREHLPAVPTPRHQAPDLVRDSTAALELLEYCRGQEGSLQGVALLLGSDDTYHPIAGDLAHPSEELRHLVGGLFRPLVSPEFLNTWAARYAPRTSPQWLRDALVESSENLVGSQVPIKGVGAASKIQHVSEALAFISQTAKGLEDVPLAMDADRNLRIFDDRTVVGLPDANRERTEQLSRRLGLRPLHKSIDDETTSRAGHRFSVSLVNELIPEVDDWDPASDSRLLVEVLGSIAHESSISPTLVEQLRSQRIWSGSDGEVHTLVELRLPARDRISRSSQVLVADDLVGEPDPSAPVYSTLRGLLRVDVLDTTEETVLACEDPPFDPAELRQLLIDLADCDRLSKAQKARLQQSTFVLCRDGQLRTPGDTLIAAYRLPLRLGDRCVDDQVGQDRGVREQLEELGAIDLPSPADLLDAATEIASVPIADDPTQDPSRTLWDHLLWSYEKYPQSTLSELATIPWLLTLPGPARRKPKDCYDPALGFAAFLFPIPMSVASPAQSFRDALRMRATLETDDCVRLARQAVDEGHTLERQYFGYINRRCERGDADERKLAALRDLPVVPLTTGPTKPDVLVSRERTSIWGHLRDLVPDQFVTDYPNLLRAWGITTDSAVSWHEHLDVLHQLGQLPKLDAREKALASERLNSIADLNLDDHQLETLRRRGLVLTSLGLCPVAEALRSDLPPAVIARLEALVPIVEESAELAVLLDQLEIRSLRSAITLEPIAQGVATEDHLPEVLRQQATNVLRFLKSSGTHLDRALLEAWPPIVRGVVAMTVRASLDGQILDEWDATAHLMQDRGDLVLFVIGGHLESRSVVDAISSVFGVDRGRKTLLLSVLNAATPQEGSKILDWENIPRLTEHESSYLHQPEETSVDFGGTMSSGEVFEPTEFSNATGDSVNDAHDDAQRDDEGEEVPSFKIDASADSDPSPAGDEAPVLPELESAVTQLDDLRIEQMQSPRGTTDLAALQDQGIVVVRDLESESVDEDYRPSPIADEESPPQDELRVCLSFFDVSNGVLPIGTRDLNWLTTGVALREVEIFGQVVTASPEGPKHVQLEDGASIFHSRQVAPGTVMRVHPSRPGRIEIEVRPDLHRLDGVWMLELDDAGKLTRLKQDDVELQWETDDLFYRAERRLEDIKALMADGGKSAVQLIIEVFLVRPEEGLTVDEVWGLVAINRLFAKATISQTLSVQTGLFEHRDGLWYKTGDELRRTRSSQLPAVRDTTRRRAQVPEAVTLARKLAQLLVDADAEVLTKVVQLLGVGDLLRDKEFSESCVRYIEAGEPELLKAIERDINRDPGLAVFAVEQLELLTNASLAKQRALIDVVVANGSAAGVSRGRDLLRRLDAVEGATLDDPRTAAEHLLLAYGEGTVSEAEVWHGVTRLWNGPSDEDPLESPWDWVEHLASNEEIYRRAMRNWMPPDSVEEARQRTIGWLSSQLAADLYDQVDAQRLRAVLDLLVGREPDVVLDGLHQLGVLAENTPGGDADAAVAYALVVAHASQAEVQSALVRRSRRRLDELNGAVPGRRAEQFAALWISLARLGSDALERAGLTSQG